MTLRIETVERIPVRIPFRDRVDEHLTLRIPERRYVEVVEVELSSGHRGYGEAKQFYGWEGTTDAAVERAEGANAVRLLWDGSLGANLQMALFDAVGRALDAPIHDLLGGSAHDRTPVGWWCTDMPAGDWLAECELAVERGYADAKLKARPWFDVREQVATLVGELPERFRLDLDFNGTLLDAERAIPLLRDVTRHPQVEIVESPIPHDDVAGYRAIRDEVDVEIAQHYGAGGTPTTPSPRVQIREDVCDGFVLEGRTDVNRIVDGGAAIAAAERALWLQVTGTGITAAFSLHCGGVLEPATWPAINSHQLYVDDLLAEPIAVEDGFAPVPDGPGLGHEVDREAIEAFRVDRPDATAGPDLLSVEWPEGPEVYVESITQLWRAALDDRLPYFEADATIEAVPDDGSDRWDRLHERTREGPVVEE